ncbi:hypothetical protein [Puniceibacterium confluentis]|nr:hypothetical protein [Puniceibacterium confluentis]
MTDRTGTLPVLLLVTAGLDAAARRAVAFCLIAESFALSLLYIGWAQRA